MAATLFRIFFVQPSSSVYPFSFYSTTNFPLLEYNTLLTSHTRCTQCAFYMYMYDVEKKIALPSTLSR